MAILRNQDGKFFEVPDDTLEKYAMAEEKVRGIAGAAEAGQTSLTLPAVGGVITINLHFGGAAPGGPPGAPEPAAEPAAEQEKEEKGQGDVKGHGWVVYANRYWAYRNQYWAYRNHY